MPVPKQKKVKRDRRDIGIFLLIVLLGIALVVALFLLNVIQELGLVLGILIVLGFVYINSPPLVLELREYQRAVIFRWGKFHRVAGPGWTFILPMIEDPVVVDLRIQTIDVPKQTVITKDNIEITIDGLVYMKVVDPKAAIINVEDYKEAAVSNVIASLRDVVGKMKLEEVISQISAVNKLLKHELAKVSKEWGIEVDSVEIQEVTLPKEVLSAMHRKKASEELKKAAEQEAKAQAIRIDAVRAAAGRLTDPALQYLYLEALKKMAEGRSSKIIFPIELTHLAERIAGTTGRRYDEVAEDLKRKYQEFLEESEEVETKPSITEEELKKGTEGKKEETEGRQIKGKGERKQHIREVLRKAKSLHKETSTYKKSKHTPKPKHASKSERT